MFDRHRWTALSPEETKTRFRRAGTLADGLAMEAYSAFRILDMRFRTFLRSSVLGKLTVRHLSLVGPSPNADTDKASEYASH